MPSSARLKSILNNARSRHPRFEQVMVIIHVQKKVGGLYALATPLWPPFRRPLFSANSEREPSRQAIRIGLECHTGVH